MHTLQLELLGKLHFAINHQPVSLVSQKARGLLIYLAVEAPYSHSREKLAALLWPDQPPTRAAHNLRQALTALRKGFEEQEPRCLVFEASREHIGISPGVRIHSDVNRFLDHVELAFKAGKADIARTDIRRLKQAAELYQGPFLQGFELKESDDFAEWVMLQRESIHRQAIRVYEYLLGYDERRRQIPCMLSTAETLLQLAPWDEQTRRMLMRLYARSGEERTAISLFHSGRKYLRESLDLEPAPETVQLFEQLRSGTADSLEAEELPAAATNLHPESTPFVGREAQLDELSSLLARPELRLITILGPGGVGKTRLAEQLAREQLGVYEDGVFFIALDHVEIEDRILPVIAHQLDIQPLQNQPIEERICQVLEKKEILLILDNFEHLQPAAGLISKLLHHTHSLQIIVTSRQQLNLQQEWVFPLASLALPGQLTRLDEIATTEAVDMFLQSCTRFGHPIQASPANLTSIVSICELVEGFPLGIELAAAAARSRSLERIHQQISTNLGSLSSTFSNLPSRHRSLRATFEHSWQLLQDSTRQALRRLSIFRGSFDIELAGSLTGSKQEEIDQLLASSLLIHDGSRCSFHPLVHQFAAEKLEENEAELAALQEAMAVEFTAAMETESGPLKSPLRVETLNRMRLDEENITAAWNWSMNNGRWDLIRQSMQSMFLYLLLQSRYQEGIKAFTLPANIPDDHTHQKDRGWLYIYKGAFALNLGKHEDAEQAYQAAETLFQSTGNVFDLAACSVRKAGVAINLGRYDATAALCTEATPVFTENGDTWWLSMSTFLLGDALYRQGKSDEARKKLEQSTEYARACGDPGRITTSLNTLADVLCYQGDFTNAEQTFRECLQISRAVQDHYGAAVHLNNLGTIFHAQRKWEDAAFAYQESLIICRSFGDRYGEAIALSNLGEIAMAKGDFDHAGSCFRQGLDISREISNTWSTLACLANLAEVSFRSMDLSSAVEWLSQGLQRAVDTSTITMLPRLLLLAARIDLAHQEKTRAASLLAQILYAEDIDEHVRLQARELVQEHALTLPPSFTNDLKASAEGILKSLSQGAGS